MTSEERMIDLMEDPEFVRELFSLESPEDVQALFSRHDTELSLKEIETLGRMINGMADAGSELFEDELEDIAGGGNSLLALAMSIGSTATASSSDVFSRRTFARW